jgi:hypothetical protein
MPIGYELALPRISRKLNRSFLHKFRSWFAPGMKKMFYFATGVSKSDKVNELVDRLPLVGKKAANHSNFVPQPTLIHNPKNAEINRLPLPPHLWRSHYSPHGNLRIGARSNEKRLKFHC